jgi:hypothetical protein
MTASVRQEAPSGITAASGTTVATPAFGGTCLVGSTLEVYVFWNGGAGSAAPSSVIDSAGQHYTYGGTTVSDSNDGTNLAVYYFPNNASATALVVTATWTSATTFRGAWAKEITGVTASPFQVIPVGQDQVSPGTGVGAISSGNITPSAQPCLLSALSYDDGGNAASVVAGSLVTGTTGFLITGNAAAGGTSASQRLTSTSPVAATFTNATDGGTRRFMTIVATYTEAVVTNSAVIAWAG